MPYVEPLPWERQRGESRQAFEAFALYRDLGSDRSYAKVARELGKSLTLIQRWGSRWDWVARAAAWDREQDRIRRETQLEAIKKMNEQHALIASAFLQKLVERLRNTDPRELPAAVMPKWFETAVKVERLARGEPTENISQEHTGKVLVTNDDTLARRVLDNPRLAALATEFFAALTADGLGENDAHRAGTAGEP